jgi:hypothetical protein
MKRRLRAEAGVNVEPAEARAIGFRVKSGYAIAVVLDGPAADPKPISRHIVPLSDPDAPETRQPHHGSRGVEMDDRREIARRTTIIERCAKQAIADLLDGQVRPPNCDRLQIRAALVVGSVIDPQTVGNPHIRAHAFEGRLFRTVLEEALTAHGVACEVIVEKQLGAQAASALKQSEPVIKRTVSAFARTLGSPWRGEEKAAATAAWTVLAKAPARALRAE